jgi:GH25 family lysozyme M1 (1,4-beta-N-acetylmuramidase)
MEDKDTSILIENEANVAETAETSVVLDDAQVTLSEVVEDVATAPEQAEAQEEAEAQEAEIQEEAEAIEEAEYLLKLVRRYDIEMPLVIDYELYDGGRLQQKVEVGEMPASSMYHDVVLAFCRRVEKAGYESAVYANYDMLTNYMDSALLDDEAVIWVAQYGGVCDVTGNYLYWQCAEDAAVGGIEGNVDHDVWYIEPGRVYNTFAKGKKNQSSIGDCRVDFDEKSYKLKNHRAKPKVTVTLGDKRLRQGRDYILSFVKNTESGTGYAIVRGRGKYKDWMAVPFAID